MTWFEIHTANEMAKERIETVALRAHREARFSGYAPQSASRFNLLTSLSKLFQGRKSTPAIAPQANTQRRTA